MALNHRRLLTPCFVILLAIGAVQKSPPAGAAVEINIHSHSPSSPSTEQQKLSKTRRRSLPASPMSAARWHRVLDRESQTLS
jgi:hypothetical protein